MEKKLKTAEKVITWAIIIVVAVLGYVLLDRSFGKEVYLPKPVEYQKPLTTAEGAVTPDRVTIPALGINAEVEHVGVDAAGRMAVPVGFENVGWFREGYLPGEDGNAVLAGHLDDGKGDPAVFINLERLSVGDPIIIEGEEGIVEYRVTGKEYYDYDVQDTSNIFGASDEPRLHLITCDGAWLEGARTYDKRLIVSAELVR